ncbi:MAG: flavodoxin family protein, partial [Desulfurococcaceae archaeon TW002]
KLLEVALETASIYGAETKLIHIYDYDIKPCEGCLSDEQLACRPPCINNDDSWTLMKEILKSDALIIATPVFWYGPPGHLKNLIDKLTIFENMIFIDGKSWVEGKVAGFIAVSAEAGAMMTIAYLMSVFNSFGYLIPPWALAYYQGVDDVLKSREAVMDSANIGKIVVEVTKLLKNNSPRKWYEPNILEVLREKNILKQVADKAENLKKETISKRIETAKRLLQTKPDDYKM